MRKAITLAAAAALALPAILLAQTAPAPQADQPPPPPQRGNVAGGDLLAGVQKAIRATDEEWKVIAPQLRKVLNARRTAEVAGAPQMGMFGGRGGGGGRRQDSFNGPGGGPRGPGGPGGPGGGAVGGPNETRPAPMADRPNAGGPPTERPENDRLNRGGAEGPPGPGGPSGPPNGPNAAGGPGPQGGPGGFRPRGGGPGMGNNPVTLAIADLQTALADEKTTKEQLAEKVANVRAARQKAKTALAEAEAELRELITSDQEIILISQGLLE